MPDPLGADHPSLRAWLAGDERAFADLHARHWRLVVTACRRRLPADEAEDAAQAVFLVLMRKSADALRSASLESWLLAVARRVIANAVRSRISRHQAERGASGAPVAVAHAATGGELLPLLDRCLAALPARERAVVTMHYLAGRTHDEIAVSLGCPKGTVYSLLSRGLERLRDRLAPRAVAPA
jgi:polysaccharide export outer membrane protein